MGLPLTFHGVFCFYYIKTEKVRCSESKIPLINYSTTFLLVLFYVLFLLYKNRTRQIDTEEEENKSQLDSLA